MGDEDSGALEGRYTMDEDDAMHVLYVRPRARLTMGIVGAFGALCLLRVVATLALGGASPWSGTALLVGIVCVVWPALHHETTRRRVGRLTTMQRSLRLSLDDARARFEDGGGAAVELPWGSFQRAFASDDAIVLLADAATGYVIPRRAFADARWAAVSALVRAKIQNVKPPGSRVAVFAPFGFAAVVFVIWVAVELAS